jgi:hypothetical protein
MLESLVLGIALVAGPVEGKGIGAAVAERLERAAAGLLVRSETDAPLKGIVGGPVPPGGLSASFVLNRFGFAPSTRVRSRTFESFLGPSMLRRPWHSPEEARRARRFRQLVAIVRRSLRDVRVFEIGETEKHVFVLGVTGTGECVGLRTIVVET